MIVALDGDVEECRLHSHQGRREMDARDSQHWERCRQQCDDGDEAQQRQWDDDEDVTWGCCVFVFVNVVCVVSGE